MHKQFTSIFLLLLCMLSCGNPSSSDGNREIVPQDYETYVIDSLSIPYLAELEILDYEEESKHLLLQDKQDRAVLIVDEEGEILEKFYPYVEGPGYVGNFSHGWVFSGADELISYGNYYFYRMKRNGEIIQRIKYPVEVKGIWSLDYSPEMLWTSSFNDRDYLIGFITEPLGHHFKTQAFQDSIDMVYKIELKSVDALENLNTEYVPEVVPIMQKQANSVYRNLNAYVDRGWPYISQINNELAVASYSIDTTLYLFNLRSNELVQEIVIPEEFRAEYETIPFGADGEPDRFKINTKVLTDGKVMILDVMGIIPESVWRKIRSQGGRWWESEALKEAGKEYYDSDRLVFDLEGNLLGTIARGVKWLNVDYQSTSEGFYWANRRYKDERDYRTFLKIGIRPVITSE